MEQYIKKSTLVAEINQRIEDYKSHKIDDSYHDGLIFVLEDLRDDFINTLEVKEVDFEEELKCYCNDYYNCDYPKQLEEGNCSEVMTHIVSAAKHFFELGLKAQKGE